MKLFLTFITATILTISSVEAKKYKGYIVTYNNDTLSCTFGKAVVGHAMFKENGKKILRGIPYNAKIKTILDLGNSRFKARPRNTKSFVIDGPNGRIFYDTYSTGKYLKFREILAKGKITLWVNYYQSQYGNILGQLAITIEGVSTQVAQNGFFISKKLELEKILKEQTDNSSYFCQKFIKNEDKRDEKGDFSLDFYAEIINEYNRLQEIATEPNSSFQSTDD